MTVVGETQGVGQYEVQRLEVLVWWGEDPERQWGNGLSGKGRVLVGASIYGQKQRRLRSSNS